MLWWVSGSCFSMVVGLLQYWVFCQQYVQKVAHLLMHYFMALGMQKYIMNNRITWNHDFSINIKSLKYQNVIIFRLPKFKAEIKIIGKLIVPRSIARYFSSVKESSNCSKNIFSQAATKSSISFESQESTYTRCSRHKNQKLNHSLSKSIDPPNLVRLDSISTCSTPTSTRRSKLSSKSKIFKKAKTKRYLTLLIHLKWI